MPAIAGPQNAGRHSLPQRPYPIAGVGLGDILDDKEVYPSLACSQSEVFRSARWCQRSRNEKGPNGSFNDTVAFLRSDDQRAYYLARVVEPAFFRSDEIYKEIDRLSKVHHQQATILNMPPKPGLPNGIIDSRGAVTLIPVDQESLDKLANGINPKIGFIVDFLGDFKRSAQERLPIYVLSGGPGMIWNALFDENGKGILRISAIDASKLTVISVRSESCESMNRL